jgi:hypothetical protein
MTETLVLTSCCKKKLNHPAPAGELYCGNMFRTVKDFAERKGYDLIIVSAKHGLVSPSQVLNPYEKVLRNRSDIGAIQPAVVASLKRMLPAYDKVIVICGKKYREAISPVIDSRFEIMTAHSYGEFVKKVKEMR